MWKLSSCLILLWICCTVQASGQEDSSGADSARSGIAVDFIRDVQPILRAHCFECHATGNEEGSLNLGIKKQALAGGDSGPVIVPQHADESLLVQLVSGTDPDRVMPPDGARLSAQQVTVLREWIEQGAHWPDGADVANPRLDRARHHWAFQRLRSVAVPAQTSGTSNPVDRFIRHRLHQSGLQPGPVASARTLARRLYFDLIGLPPTPEQTAEFVADADEDRDTAINHLTDKLLASQHYGERWGRHWLDVARYTDSDGEESDRNRPTAFPYRDFVIRSFNDDLPFDTFVKWQIAGDEFEPDSAAAFAATGFLVAGTHTVLADTFLEEERLRNQYNELDDIVSTLGSSMLGLTIGCARCHDHKYDAITARDYYQLVHVFHSGHRHSGEIPGGSHALHFRETRTEPQTSWLFERADFNDRDEEVSLGFPVILSGSKSAQDYWAAARAASDPANITSTLQRRALAEWMTDTEDGAGALLARVIVNRVWHHHFGHGLVRTLGDFGVRGEQPSHPDLLEWLAGDFIAHGWKLKHLHRRIVSSATYQQSGTFDADKSAIDPDNRLLWRRTPQRLEAEIIRDTLLAVSGTLNRKPFGPGFMPPIADEGIVARNLKGGEYPRNVKEGPATRRRSVYMFHRRLVPYPLLQAFDRPDLLKVCVRRENTTVAPQALVMLNDHFVRRRAEDFATRLLEMTDNNLPEALAARQPSKDPALGGPVADDGGLQESDIEVTESNPETSSVDHAAIAQTAFELALCRRATDTEQAAAVAFLESQNASRSAREQENAQQAAVADFCQALFGLNEFIYVD